MRETREWEAGNLKAIGRGGGEAILGPGGPTHSSPFGWRWLLDSETRARRKFSPEPRVSPFPATYLVLSVSFSRTLSLFLVRTGRAPRARTTRLIRARVCVSQRVRVISRLERLQVREEAANV